MRERRLSSRDNPRVKLYRSLDRREAREASGLMAAEGVRLVIEALRGGRVTDLFLADTLDPEHLADIRRARESGGESGAVWRLPGKIFRGMAHTLNPQGAAALVRIPGGGPVPEELAKLRKVIVLHRPQDPGNVGTVLRCAEAASFDAAVIVEPACDPFGPKAVRASMGSIFRVRVQRWPSWGGVAEVLAAAGFQIMAADPRSRSTLWDLPTRSPLAVVFGGETAGLPDLGHISASRFSLPMEGKVESLNLAMAVSIVLYEIRRRELATPRRMPGECRG